MIFGQNAGSYYSPGAEEQMLVLSTYFDLHISALSCSLVENKKLNIKSSVCSILF